MGFKTLKSMFIIIAISLLTLLLFQNCGVQKPKVEDMSSIATGFSHSPIPASCITCHADAKPTVPKTLAADGISNLFSHVTLYNGDQDCATCHTQNQALVGVSWMNGVFNHMTNQGVSVPTCTECHTGNRPTALVGPNKDINHADYGTRDCFECHKNIGVDWFTTSSANHTLNQQECIRCHISKLPSPTTYLPSNAAKPNSNLFVHATQYNGLSECVTCHINPGAAPVDPIKPWSGARYDHMTNAAVKVSNCLNCHTGDRPAATVFYPSDPAAPTSNLFAHATQYNGTADCASCHMSVPTNIGVNWAGGTFNHKSNTGATVTTCLACHEGDRPTIQTGPISHTTANGRMGDCTSCHGNNAGVTWSKQPPVTVTMDPPTGTSLTTITIKHPVVQTGMSCSTCHNNYNATNSVKGFDHAEGLVLASNNTKVANSCYYCHYDPNKVIDSVALPNNNNGSKRYIPGTIAMRPVNHEGGLTGRASCTSCHRSATSPNWNTTTKTWSAGTW